MGLLEMHRLSGKAAEPRIIELNYVTQKLIQRYSNQHTHLLRQLVNSCIENAAHDEDPADISNITMSPEIMVWMVQTVMNLLK